MYSHAYTIDHLPKKYKMVLDELHPQQTSDLQFFLKNTECFHDLNEWAREERKRKENFFNKYQITKEHYHILRIALNQSKLSLPKPIFMSGKKYTKILKKKKNKKQDAIYFRPLKIYLSN